MSSIKLEPNITTRSNKRRMDHKFIGIKTLPRKLGLIDQKKPENNQNLVSREVWKIQVKDYL